MKGLKRGIDSLGRITIPKEFRKALHLGEYDEVVIVVEGESIRLTKAIESCNKCGCTTSERLTTLDGTTLCDNCIQEFSKNY